jgi:hypothetical protein
MAAVQNFISREQVLEIVKGHPDLVSAISLLFSFPAPNPEWMTNNRNIMGQTEDEFWDKVDRQG